MEKKTSKTFSIFWVITGLIWLMAAVRHFIVKDDMAGTIIYLAAAIISLILALAYYKNFVK